MVPQHSSHPHHPRDKWYATGDAHGQTGGMGFEPMATGGALGSIDQTGACADRENATGVDRQ